MVEPVELSQRSAIFTIEKAIESGFHKKKLSESRKYFLTSKMDKRRICPKKKVHTLIRDLTNYPFEDWLQRKFGILLFWPTITLCINNYNVMLMKSMKGYREN